MTLSYSGWLLAKYHYLRDYRKNSTLIDNIYTNNLKDFTAVVLGDHISDHQAIIVSADTELPRRPEKYVTIRSNDEQSKIKFCETVAHMNVASLLDIRADVEPNNNYAIVENSLKTAMDNSFTVKRVDSKLSEPSMRGISCIEN